MTNRNMESNHVPLRSSWIDGENGTIQTSEPIAYFKVIEAATKTKMTKKTWLPERNNPSNVGESAGQFRNS